MSDDFSLTRRRLLVGAGAGTAVAAGCITDDREDIALPGPGESERTGRDGPTVPRSDRFDNVVNAADAGADPNEGLPINRHLDAQADDDTLIFLPEGRYKMDDTWSFDDFSNFGIAGDGATIIPPRGYDNVLFSIGENDSASDFLFEGVSFDFRDDLTGGRPIYARVRDGLEIRDVTVTGVQDVAAEMMRFDVTDRAGSGLVERLILPDGAEAGTEATGCYIGGSHRGEITFKNCHIERFPDNGLYAEPPAGTVNVTGGMYKNNNVANVRLGTEGVIKGVQVVCDAAPDGWGNMRGIRLSGGSGIVVEGCDLKFHDVVGSDGAITLSSEMGAATIRETAITVDTDGVIAVAGKPPEPPGEHQSLTCDTVCITGSAAEAAAIVVSNRRGSRFDRIVIHQTGDRRDGMRFEGCDDGLVRNSDIHVTGDPLVLEDSTVTTDNVNVHPTRPPALSQENLLARKRRDSRYRPLDAPPTL